MSFLLDLADFIEVSIPSLEVDTNLFLGGTLPDSPDTCCVLDNTGGIDNESGIIRQNVQVLVRGLGYLTGESLIDEIYTLISHKPGFAALGDIFYSIPISRPSHLSLDGRNRDIFSANLTFYRK